MAKVQITHFNFYSEQPTVGTQSMGQNQMNVPNRGARPSSLALVNQTQPVQQTAVMPTLNPSVGSPSVVAGYPRLNMVPEVPYSIALFRNNMYILLPIV